VEGCFAKGCLKREKSVTSVIDRSPGKQPEAERFSNRNGGRLFGGRMLEEEEVDGFGY
jgi:hypothetical protein